MKPFQHHSAVIALCALTAAFPAIAKEKGPPLAPVIMTGVGYAPISTQPATTDEERRLLAIRASQLAAIRNLAEQIHGLRLESASRTAGSTVQSDSIRAVVSGTVAGARIVKITPKGDDTYETVVEAERPVTSARR